MARNHLLLYGRNSVLERLKASPRSIRSIWLQDNFNFSPIENLVRSNNIEVERLSFDHLARKKPSAKDLQGVVARVDLYRYTPYEKLLEKIKADGLTPIFLDGLGDPHNLGVIIRTAACLGKFAVVIPGAGACEVNETVMHVASGGENYVMVSKVPDLSAAILKAKESGCTILGGLVNRDTEDINKVSFSFPTGIVLGGEGRGISNAVRKVIDLNARIPMEGSELTFNVNIVCAIFCHEIAKRKRSDSEKAK